MTSSPPSSVCLTCAGGEVPVLQHSGAQQRQVAVSSEREEVQGSRVCAQTHSQQARREGHRCPAGG